MDEPVPEGEIKNVVRYEPACSVASNPNVVVGTKSVTTNRMVASPPFARPFARQSDRQKATPAYQVIGNGSVDFVYFGPWFTHVENRKDLTAGSGLIFEDAGEHELKGVPGRWHLDRVVK